MNFNPIFVKFFYFLIWPIFHLIYPFKVVGKSNIPDGNFIICSNHYSWTDPFYLFLMFGPNGKIIGLSKKELFKNKLFGKIYSMLGAIPINRESSDIKALKAAINGINNGYKLVIFPEGTRDKEEKFNGHNGAAYLAIKTRKDILPIYIQSGRRFFRMTKIIVGEIYSPAINDTKPTQSNLKDITKELMTKIRTLKDSIEK